MFIFDDTKMVFQSMTELCSNYFVEKCYVLK